MSNKAFANWDELLEAVRSLGGVIENVTLTEKAGVRGLCAINPLQPIRMHIPDQLLVTATDIETDGSTLNIRAGATYSDAVRTFFRRYHLFTSWGGGGRENSAEFLTGLYRLPKQVKQVLQEEFNMKNMDTPPDGGAILNHFVNSRVIRKGDRRVMMPIIELVNHATWGLPFETNSPGITLAGSVKSEVFARYSLSDTWRKFQTYGFAPAERFAFSQTFSVEPKTGAQSIMLRDAVSERTSEADGLPAPVVTVKDGGLNISFLLLGDRKNPANPVALFRRHVKPHLDVNAEEFFETIVFINRLKYLRVLDACEGHSGKMIELIKRAARLQLETLTYCWFGPWSSGRAATLT